MPDQGQLELVPGPRRKRTSRKREVPITATAPVAQVVVDSPLPHLDRPFDYSVPESLAHTCQVGSRVRVRFAGRLVDAIVTARGDSSDHTLKPIERVLGPEPVLTDQTLALLMQVADRYSGTFSDVVRSAVPPRHARAEASAFESTAVQSTASAGSESECWSAYDHGPALIRRLSEGGLTRAVWASAPASSWTHEVMALADAVLAEPSGGVLIVAPDARDVDRLLRRAVDARDAGVLSVLTSDQGPERRYREFLRALRGVSRLVVGTRGAVFAPVRDLRLVIVWDDGDDLLRDPQAPYWHARDVAAMRSVIESCSLVVGSPARTVVTQQWCESGWARSVEPTRDVISARGPVVRALSANDAGRDEAAASARIPHEAWTAVRAAAKEGPVLIQVPRRGYVPILACQSCRNAARCTCGGPLALHSGASVPGCRWCGALAVRWTCASCGSRTLRAIAVGSERTAEEIGRAFPGVKILMSHGGHMIGSVPDEPLIVVATPGAEPDCERGYRTVLLLDAREQLERPHLDADEQAMRRWCNAARLAAPRARVVVTADNSLTTVQALVRWDSSWRAARDLAERASASLPPVVRMAALLGTSADIADVVSRLSVAHRQLGPVEHGDSERALISVERELGGELSHQLRGITAARSAQARTAPVQVRMDPDDL